MPHQSNIGVKYLCVCVNVTVVFGESFGEFACQHIKTESGNVDSHYYYYYYTHTHMYMYRSGANVQNSTLWRHWEDESHWQCQQRQTKRNVKVEHSVLKVVSPWLSSVQLRVGFGGEHIVVNYVERCKYKLVVPGK